MQYDDVGKYVHFDLDDEDWPLRRRRPKRLVGDRVAVDDHGCNGSAMRAIYHRAFAPIYRGAADRRREKVSVRRRHAVKGEFTFARVSGGESVMLGASNQSSCRRKVHIRLSHTHNNVPGRSDYTGEVDPRRLALAITQEDQQALFVNGHDLYLAGQDVVFHHNWINNLNDEGLFLDSADSLNTRVYQPAFPAC